MKRNSISAVSLFGGAVAASAVLGMCFTPAKPGIRDWYDRLRKSPVHPPDAVFGPVWTILYALIAVSGAQMWRSPQGPARTRALQLWSAQMALNAAWTPIFFGAKKPALALADIGLLLPTIIAYARTSKTPWLMAPYAAWVAFATYLNAEVVRLNHAR